jgi:hypothetical protein
MALGLAHLRPLVHVSVSFVHKYIIDTARTSIGVWAIWPASLVMRPLASGEWPRIQREKYMVWTASFSTYA